jgi:hypothetical protein
MEILRRRPLVAALCVAALAASCDLFWIGGFVEEMSGTGIASNLAATAMISRADIPSDRSFMGIAAFSDAVFVICKTKVFKYEPGSLRLLATYALAELPDYHSMDEIGCMNRWSAAWNGTSYYMSRCHYRDGNLDWITLEVPANAPEGAVLPGFIFYIMDSASYLRQGADTVVYSMGTYTINAESIQLALASSFPGSDSSASMYERTFSDAASGTFSVWGFKDAKLEGNSFDVKVIAAVLRQSDIGPGPNVLVPVSFSVSHELPPTSYPRTGFGFFYIPGVKRDVSILSSWGDMVVGVHSTDGKLLQAFRGYSDRMNGIAVSDGGLYIVRDANTGSAYASVSFYRWP